MISHVVLFRPKPSLSDSQRQSLVVAIATAARSIPSVVRFTVGRRLIDGRDMVCPGAPSFLTWLMSKSLIVPDSQTICSTRRIAILVDCFVRASTPRW